MKIIAYCDRGRHKQEWLLCSHATGQPYRDGNYDPAGRYIGPLEERMFVPAGGQFPYRVGCDVMAMCWKCKARALSKDIYLELWGNPSLIWAFLPCT